MAYASEPLRRWLGVFCLCLASGLLIWGQTILKPKLEGLMFLVYWGVCFLFTFGAIVIALWDILAIRRRVREEHRSLLRRTMEEVETQEQERRAERGTRKPDSPAD